MLLAWSLFPTLSFTQDFSVQSGATVNVGGGSLNLNCGDLTVAGNLGVGSGSVASTRHVNISGGTLSLGSGSITLSGDWINSGTFSAGSGSVNVVDGCGTTSSAMTGDSTFYHFIATTTAGRTLLPTSGSTQTFSRSLSLSGTSANRLAVRSSQAGSAANFTLADGGSQNISGVDVADNNADGGLTLAPGAPQSFNSIDSGGNTNWFIAIIQPAVPVNTLPLPALLLLILLLGVLVWKPRHLLASETLRP